MIDDQLFYKFSTIIYKKIGLFLPLKKKYLLYTRLTGRLRSLGLNNFENYYELISRDKTELAKLYNLLTTNVTHFFREKHHFKYLEEKVLPGFVNKRDKRISAWSAGCSTGEEAYSLAITLAQFFQNEDWDIEVLATDINTEVLSIASKAIYPYQKIKNIPYELLCRYFMLGKGNNEGFFKVKREIRELIQVKQLNLNHKDYKMTVSFDFIFCRNVFIYFTRETRGKILNNFYDYLKDDGYLFLGHADAVQLTDKWRQVGNTTFRKAR
ncbi:protein-glutamate O-methyltransferase [Halocella sp. SP3-1]|uniref:CheR family methyltransferase n=1 Tax=Halocella sp. SP3-1 TaxID=2382161 RepID=UPI000F758F19|nr:protein-glutamate O-methyltransferase [Halocella sp. SP3-1]AZO93269.1 methyltransferase domain-containing protein [Halocella sp. SP3-1]MTI61454.1 methyltransferase domain-containing protein [Bacillota bacterium]